MSDTVSPPVLAPEVADLHRILNGYTGYSQTILITDERVRKACFNALDPVWLRKMGEIMEIPVGEEHKNLATCGEVWRMLTNTGMDRHGLVVNIGGGVVTDLGGFAAATFKRGVDFVQVPTTLLAMVDAAIGGKTGVDFELLKNQIGLFARPVATVLHPPFIRTLPERELLSGFAECVKHALIGNATLWHELQTWDRVEMAAVEALIPDFARVKVDIVAQDPRESGLRKALNYGHTIGHALETWMIGNGASVTHGHCVAMGMYLENKLAVALGLLDAETASEINAVLDRLFGLQPFPGFDVEEVVALMRHDKKNRNGLIKGALIGDVGVPLVDVILPPENVVAVLQAIRG